MKSVRARDTASDLARFFEELSAADTRAAAEDIFDNSGWLFIGVDPAEREKAYARAEDIIREKPE
jgi:hypothetical protein